MEIRRILVNFEIDRFSPGLAAFAVAMAERFNAAVIGFSSGIPLPVFVGVNGAVAAASIYAEQRLETEQQLEALRQDFLAAMPSTIRHEWRQMVEAPDRG